MTHRVADIRVSSATAIVESLLLSAIGPVCRHIHTGVERACRLERERLGVRSTRPEERDSGSEQDGVDLEDQTVDLVPKHPSE